MSRFWARKSVWVVPLDPMVVEVVRPASGPLPATAAAYNDDGELLWVAVVGPTKTWTAATGMYLRPRVQFDSGISTESRLLLERGWDRDRDR